MGRVEGKRLTRVDLCSQPMEREFYPSPTRVGKNWQVVGFLLPVGLVLTQESDGNGILGGDPKFDPGSDRSLYLNPHLCDQTKVNPKLTI